MNGTITSVFQDDHKRLDGLLATYQALRTGDPDKAKDRFVEFVVGLQRHIAWEEDVLFPEWQRRTGISDRGPTAIMRMEHRLIGEALDAVHRKVRAADPHTDAELDRLMGLLSQHNRKEEMVLYPDLDAWLGDADRARLFAEMDAIPPDRYETCCDGR